MSILNDIAENWRRRIADLTYQNELFKNGTLTTGSRQLEANGTVSSTDTTAINIQRNEEWIADLHRLLAGKDSTDA